MCPALHSQTPARPDGIERLVGLIRELHALDAARADQDVPVPAGGVAEEVQVAPLQADDLVDKSHGMPLGGEPAEGDGGPVRHQGGRLGQTDQFARHVTVSIPQVIDSTNQWKALASSAVRRFERWAQSRSASPSCPSHPYSTIVDTWDDGVLNSLAANQGKLCRLREALSMHKSTPNAGFSGLLGDTRFELVTSTV